jgi:hypothetical protein
LEASFSNSKINKPSNEGPKSTVCNKTTPNPNPHQNQVIFREAEIKEIPQKDIFIPLIKGAIRVDIIRTKHG